MESILEPPCAVFTNITTNSVTRRTNIRNRRRKRMRAHAARNTDLVTDPAVTTDNVVTNDTAITGTTTGTDSNSTDTVVSGTADTVVTGATDTVITGPANTDGTTDTPSENVGISIAAAKALERETVRGFEAELRAVLGAQVWSKEEGKDGGKHHTQYSTTP
jgi:hypothetical protein